MTETTYAHAECQRGSHHVETGEETVTFICSETGETWTSDRCIAINVGARFGERCNAAASLEGGPMCHAHSRTRTVCAKCGTKVHRNGKTGHWSHDAGHPFESIDGIHCWTCGLVGKERYRVLGHSWGHEPKPIEQGYATVRD